MNQPISCLVVDDEPPARHVLKQYIEDTPNLNCTGYCSDALEAMKLLNDTDINLLFLDINMPKLSGISFLKSLKQSPAVILTTAYEEYALQGYELNAIDYLLKPFSFERFLIAVKKAATTINSKNTVPAALVVKADKKIYRVDPKNILFIKSIGDYVTIYTTTKTLTVYKRLKDLEDELQGTHFLRVHKSYIISMHHIAYMQGNIIRIAKENIPIGTTYRQEVKDLLSP